MGALIYLIIIITIIIIWVGFYYSKKHETLTTYNQLNQILKENTTYYSRKLNIWSL